MPNHAEAKTRQQLWSEPTAHTQTVCLCVSLKGHCMRLKGVGMSLSLSCVHHQINYVLDVCGRVYVCLLSASMVTMSITAACFLCLMLWIIHSALEMAICMISCSLISVSRFAFKYESVYSLYPYHKWHAEVIKIWYSCLPPPFHEPYKYN